MELPLGLRVYLYDLWVLCLRLLSCIFRCCLPVDAYLSTPPVPSGLGAWKGALLPFCSTITTSRSTSSIQLKSSTLPLHSHSNIIARKFFALVKFAISLGLHSSHWEALKQQVGVPPASRSGLPCDRHIRRLLIAEWCVELFRRHQYEVTRRDRATTIYLRDEGVPRHAAGWQRDGPPMRVGA